MNIQHVLKTLKDHADEEVQIHKEVFNEPDKSIKYLYLKVRKIKKKHKSLTNFVIRN